MDKLVRDKIPEIVEANGASDKYTFHACKDKDERIKRLLDKVFEETAELVEKPCLEEMADVLEVIYALAEAMNHSREDLENTRREKQELRGAFKKGLIINWSPSEIVKRRQ